MTQEPTSDVGREVAARVRAEMARQGIRNSTLAARLGCSEMWVGRRVRVEPSTSMTIAELERIATVLDVPVTRFLPTAAEPTPEVTR